MPQEIQLFGNKQIRTYWDEEQEMYYFCIVDVVEALTESNDPKQYIKRIRQRDPELNSVWGTICTPHHGRTRASRIPRWFRCTNSKRSL